MTRTRQPPDDPPTGPTLTPTELVPPVAVRVRLRLLRLARWLLRLVRR